MGQESSKPKSKQSDNKKLSSPPKRQTQNVPFQEKEINTIKNIEALEKMQQREDQIKEFTKQQFEKQDDLKQLQDINIKDCIDLKLIPRFNAVQVNKSDSQTIPVMVSLETKAPENFKSNRAPIDLVCVIDDSGSMYGQKAQLVRQSLKYLLKILNENDRICLISYDCNATVLTPMLKNTPENKEELKKAIKHISGKGSTNTTSGIEHGLWMLKNRKQCNPVSCMFLLSDGVDNQGTQLIGNVQTLLKKYDIQQEFTINSYGYGTDHSPEVMRNIANLKTGNFYFIENLKKVSDWFILSLSGLLTVLGEKIQIRLRQEQNFPIQKYYGDEQLWDQDYIIHLPHLVQNSKKEYLIEVKIPSFKKELKDEQKRQKIISVQMVGTALEGTDKNIEVNTELQLLLLNENEPISEQDVQPNEKLEVCFYRAKGGEIIGDACKLAEQGKYDEANKLLDELISEIDKSEFKEVNGIQFIRSDAVKSKDVCKPQVFQQKGKAFMFKKNKDHIQRQASLCNIEDWDENQQDMFNKYENEEYCLSDDSVGLEVDNKYNRNDSGLSDSDENSNISVNNIQQKQKKRQNSIRQFQCSDDEDYNFSDDEEDLKHNSRSFVEDDNEEDEDLNENKEKLKSTANKLPVVKTNKKRRSSIVGQQQLQNEN